MKIERQDFYERIFGTKRNIPEPSEIEKKAIGRVKNKPIEKEGFIYVPSINLYVAKERTLLGESFYNTQEELHSNNQKMLTIPEFREFLKYTSENHRDIYNEITEVRSPWRAEWLDADFTTSPNKDLAVNYHIFDENGNIVKKTETLDKNTLMKDKTPGISLENWLENSTTQGLPSKDSEEGDLYYWYPRSDDNSVARFDAGGGGAGLNFYGGPSGGSNLGVRAVMLAGRGGKGK